MNIVMFGPGYGHNIEPFLEFFENSRENKLYFFYLGKFTFENKRFKNINIISIEKSFFKLWNIYKVFKKADLVWIHGAYRLLILSYFLVWANKKSIKIINIWGEKVAEEIVANNLRGKVYQHLSKHIDYIQCNWYGTAEILKKNISEKKILIFPWGLPSAFFQKVNNQKITKKTSEFVSQFPKDKKIFFYPKSLLGISGHNMVIDTVIRLLEEGFKNFYVIFWKGNTNDPKIEKALKQKIVENNLQKYICLEDHDFVSNEDLKYIWKNIDIGLQIAYNDQLSSTFIEPMYYEKELIATNIFPYRAWEEKFHLNLELIDLNIDELFLSMKKILNNHTTNILELNRRKEVIINDYCFDKNIKKILDFYSEKIC